VSLFDRICLALDLPNPVEVARAGARTSHYRGVGGVREVLQTGGGVVSTATLNAAGFSNYRIRQLIDQKVLVRVIHGVFALSETVADAARDPASEHALVVSAHLLQSPGLVASHHSAARIHHIELISGPGLPPLPGVTLTRALKVQSRSARGGTRVYRAGLPASHVTTRCKVPVTTPERTIADLARCDDFLRAVAAADSALRRRKVSKSKVHAILDECSRWPGASGAQRVIDFASGLAESPLESAARVIFHESGLPPPRLQGQVWGLGDLLFEYRADFLWDDQRTIVETDGALKYEDPGRARQQLRRDRLLREAGYEVVHVTWDELFFHTVRVIARIRDSFNRSAAIALARQPPRIDV
jgi:very-short-patch-repair endonuclease